jgi:hypothetical protein
MIAMQSFEGLKVLKCFEIKSDRIFAECGIKETEVITRSDFLTTHSIHWGIECYHRAIKQLCGIKKIMVRSSPAIVTHFFCSILDLVQLELMRAEALIDNWYEIQKNLSLEVARDFILHYLNQKVGLKAEY